MTAAAELAGLAARGWQIFPADAALMPWVAAARPAAIAALARDPARARCGGTWRVGLDLLDNDETGAVAGVPLAGAAVTALARGFGRLPLHRAQLSTVLPGYPRPSPEEDEVAFRFRLRRDSAHVDGILPVGPARRRMIREPHAWILGLPLTAAGAGASPPVVWEGSHRIMARALRAALAGVAPEDQAQTDITEAYRAARREVFARCRRVVLDVRPGEAVVIHRLALHGISPWRAGAEAPPEGRIIAWFRPGLPGGIAAWLGGPV